MNASPWGDPPLPRAAIGLWLLMASCRPTAPSPDWARVPRGSAPGHDSQLPPLLSDAELKNFLPAQLGRRPGEPAQGSMTWSGSRALSEVRRNYNAESASSDPNAGRGRIELKLADALLEPRAAQAVRSLSADQLTAGGHHLGAEGAYDEDGLPRERLVLPGAIGYVRYDQEERVAQAQVLIAGRFIASASVAEADDGQEAAQALRAVDTLALARLARASP